MENRAGVNQENVSRQVVPCTTSGRATFSTLFWRFIAISSLCITRANLAVINCIARHCGRSTRHVAWLHRRFPWREHEPDNKSRNQSAKMSRHADLWRREIEHNLNHDDHRDVGQTLLRARRVTMSKQESRPRAHDTHHASRRADQLSYVNETKDGQQHNARTGSKS